jgi:hypothetical protein
MAILYWSASCPLTNPGVNLGILINTGFGGFPSLAAVQGHKTERNVVDRRVICAEEYRKYPECSNCTLTPSPETDDNIVIL